MNNPNYFHFTLGPVQGFIAQARRTRDFWAGSFILSWLSAVAMRAVTAQNGTKILFPMPDENYMAWLEGDKNKQSKDTPRQGGVPNRFLAEIPAQGFNPDAVVESVQIAWRELAEIVWQKDLQAYAAKDSETRKIWDRQIGGFWEMSWAITDSREDSSAIDRRKNIRSHFAPQEPGVKCMVMEGWQELSGIAKPSRDGLDAFWGKLRLKKRDVREGEHLSALAFVKRRFVHYFKDVQVPMGNWIAHGWQLDSGVPSVAYMAAVHWLETLIKQEPVAKLQALLSAADEIDVEYGEWNTDIRCIQQAYAEAEKGKRTINRLKRLDGDVFFKTALSNPNMYDQNKVKPMLRALDALETQAVLSPFYAILLMDGDSLGKHMSDPDKQESISNALKDFTDGVPEVVYCNNGFLIYAGGDDVLAVLPLEDALPCAVAIRKHYKESFLSCKQDELKKMTISAAVEFAHIKMPLTKVLRDAHDLLDHVAKDGCGRDALAVRVWKPGGEALEWAMPFDLALKDEKLWITILTEQFLDKEKKDAAFSNKFFYKIRERFAFLTPLDETAKPILSADQQIALLAVEYLNSGVNETRKKDDKLDMAKAQAEIKPLLEQCRRAKRDLEQLSKGWPREPLQVDGALLVRFLASKGIERAGAK
jgi:CRISPR-associated protein Cmr2